MAACPICKRPAAPRGDGSAFPFCSARCKQVDLGQWLEESYRIAGDPRDAPGLDEREEEG
jgi:endogenous inhibitor of DNA gyrase (YacG/DUF329 family)